MEYFLYIKNNWLNFGLIAAGISSIYSGIALSLKNDKTDLTDVAFGSLFLTAVSFVLGPISILWWTGIILAELLQSKKSSNEQNKKKTT